MKVHIHLHNIGKNPIYSVNVTDNWAPVFEISPNSANQNKCFYEVIEAESNVTCEEIFLPKHYGVLNMDTASVSYRLSQDADETLYYVHGHPSAEATLDVLPTALYRRYYTSHTRPILAFILICCFFTLVPYALLKSTKTVNDYIRQELSPQKRKQK